MSGLSEMTIIMRIVVVVVAAIIIIIIIMPIPVAERSKAWVCSRSPAEIAGSNPSEGMVVCLL
jgi:hypothetical protein